MCVKLEIPCANTGGILRVGAFVTLALKKTSCTNIGPNKALCRSVSPAISLVHLNCYLARGGGNLNLNLNHDLCDTGAALYQ